MKTIAAVVVTFNRLAELRCCLEQLRAQSRPLDEIIVVDNGSTDGTGAWLATERGLVVITQANSGGAGGFATGIATAFERGFEGFWCMDDDCVPSREALAALVDSPRLGAAIKNCMSVSTKDGTELAFYVDRPNRNYRKVTDMTDQDVVYGVASLFNGTLIDAEVVRAIGIPDRTLFIWGDEVEYMTRAMRRGFPVVTIPAAVLRHPPAFDREGIPWPGAWKQYYAVRNQRRIFQNLHGGKIGYCIYCRWSLAAALRQLRTRRPNRMYDFLIYVEAAWDSLTGNFRKRPETIRTLQLFRANHRSKPA